MIAGIAPAVVATTLAGAIPSVLPADDAATDAAAEQAIFGICEAVLARRLDDPVVSVTLLAPVAAQPR